MPCYDGRSESRERIEIQYVNGVNPNIHSNLINENNYLEACLCAIITELEKKKIANEIITKASRSGLLNIMSFWLEHSKKDKTRISNEFHSFSEHEQSLIRKLIINGEL